MLYDEKTFEFEIIDVLRFKRKSIKYYTPKRDFSVLTCRLYGETDFEACGKTVHASSKEFVIIPSMCEYVQKSTDEEIICIHFRGNSDIDELTQFYCSSPKVTQLFVLAHETWKKKARGYTFLCKSIMYNILYELINSSGESFRSPVAASVEYIHTHFSEVEFNIAHAIEKSYLSFPYFRRVFKKQYGITPVAYVTKLRIDYAKSLLMTSGFSLKEIAYMCGFSEEKYFFSVFRKVTGTTPSKWVERCIFE